MYEIAELINGDRGKNYPSKDKLHSSGIPFISAINLEHGTVVKDKLLYLSEKQYNLLGSGKLQKDDLIFCLRGSLGKNGIYPFENGAIASSLVILRLFSQSLLNLTYFNFYINSPLINSEINKHNNGTAQPNLSAGNVAGFYFPLPPLNEQHRIVAKIEELLPFIEQYDQKEQQLTALNKNFPEQLKKSILQAAIQGKLTEQLPTDEPASELLKRIQAEKARLISEKKVKKPKHSSEIIVRDNLAYEIKAGVERCIADEIPFDIPESWCWVRLGDLVFNLGQKTPMEKFCYIDIGSIDNKKHKLADIENIIDAKDAPSRARKLIQNGTILYSTVRPYLQNICIVDKYFKYEPIASTAFAVMNVFSDFYNKYLFYYLLSPTFTEFVNQVMVGVAYPAINDENLYKFLVPIPPINEQHRIVAKIEQLLSNLQKLE